MLSIKMITGFVLAFLFATVFGKYYIPWLRKQKAGQEIKGQVEWHKSKAGTPTMGGIIFIFAVAFVCLTVGFQGFIWHEHVHFFIFIFASIFGAIGFLDDWEKIKHKQNLGLSAKAKFLLQLVASLVFVLLMREIGYVRPSFYIPFVNIRLDVPEWLYFLLSSFIIVGTVNAVNITDGIDGLATGSSIPVCLFFVAYTYYWQGEFYLPGLFASALLGGLFGFLTFNFNPAKCFMGDTGSLFLGGAIAGMAFVYDLPLMLLPLGLVFFIETLSDIIQVAYFKITHGKRVFKMAPFHHHLEMGGWTGKKWKEKEIFWLFTGISAVMAVISFIGIMHRY